MPVPIKEPLRIDQAPSGCWIACIAGITHLPHDELLEFLPSGAFDRNDPECIKAWNLMEIHVREYLLARGWWLPVGAVGSQNEMFAPRGYSIGAGMSPRGILHACIVLDGRLWHDPHPSRAGVEKFTEYEVLIPLRCAAAD